MKDLYIERYKWDWGMETVFSEQGDSYIPPKILEYNKHKLLRQLKLRWGFCNYRLLYLYLEQLFILYNRREMILIYILTNLYS